MTTTTPKPSIASRADATDPEAIRHARVLRREGSIGPRGRQRVPTRALPGAAELEPAGVPKLVYFNELDRGNHFAAWQEPELFIEEVRKAFRPLR
jgi:hypothetical protein